VIFHPKLISTMTPLPQTIRCISLLAVTAALLMATDLFSVRASPAGPAGSPRTFSSPAEAVKALADATKIEDHATIDAIFGPDVKELLSGDAKQDALEFAAFAQSIGTYAQLVQKSDDQFVLNIGDQNWPFPIPLVRKAGVWSFDTAAGKEEIVNRRIGADELNAIGVCRTYLAAQREFASVDRNGDGVFEFAQRLRSTPGHKDGLYWPTRKRVRSARSSRSSMPMAMAARRPKESRSRSKGIVSRSSRRRAPRPRVEPTITSSTGT